MSLVDDAFDNLKKSLEITQTESKTAARRHKEIRDHVRTEWDLDDDFLTGSYRRDTKTKRLKDVDIFVVIQPTGAQGGLRDKPPATVLDRLVTLLKKTYENVVADGFAATIDFGTEDDVMSFDVVPAYDHPDGGYEIPNARTGDWIRTNPKTHHELSTAKNKECDEKQGKNCSNRSVPPAYFIYRRDYQPQVRPPHVLKLWGSRLGDAAGQEPFEAALGVRLRVERRNLQSMLQEVGADYWPTADDRTAALQHSRGRSALVLQLEFHASNGAPRFAHAQGACRSVGADISIAGSASARSSAGGAVSSGRRPSPTRISARPTAGEAVTTASGIEMSGPPAMNSA